MEKEAKVFRQHPKLYNDVLRQIANQKTVEQAIKIAAHNHTLR